MINVDVGTPEVCLTGAEAPSVEKGERAGGLASVVEAGVTRAVSTDKARGAVLEAVEDEEPLAREVVEESRPPGGVVGTAVLARVDGGT